METTAKFVETSFESSTLELAIGEWLKRGESLLVLADWMLRRHLLEELIDCGRHSKRLAAIVRLLVVIGRLTNDPYAPRVVLKIKSKGPDFEIANSVGADNVDIIKSVYNDVFGKRSDCDVKLPEGLALRIVEQLEVADDADSLDRINKDAILLVEMLAVGYTSEEVQGIATGFRQIAESRGNHELLSKWKQWLSEHGELASESFLGLLFARFVTRCA